VRHCQLAVVGEAYDQRVFSELRRLAVWPVEAVDDRCDLAVDPGDQVRVEVHVLNPLLARLELPHRPVDRRAHHRVGRRLEVAGEVLIDTRR
jgi:hypothetical protein